MTAEMAEMKQNILTDLRNGKKNRYIVDDICKRYPILYETFMLVFGRTQEYMDFVRCQSNIAAKKHDPDAQTHFCKETKRQSRSYVWWTDERKQETVDLYNSGLSGVEVAAIIGRSPSDTIENLRKMRDSKEYYVRLPRNSGARVARPATKAVSA